MFGNIQNWFSGLFKKKKEEPKNVVYEAKPIKKSPQKMPMVLNSEGRKKWYQDQQRLQKLQKGQSSLPKLSTNNINQNTLFKQKDQQELDKIVNNEPLEIKPVKHKPVTAIDPRPKSQQKPSRYFSDAQKTLIRANKAEDVQNYIKSDAEKLRKAMNTNINNVNEEYIKGLRQSVENRISESDTRKRRMTPHFSTGKSFDEIAKNAGYSRNQVANYAKEHYKDYGKKDILTHTKRVIDKYLVDPVVETAKRPYNALDMLDDKKKEKLNRDLVNINKKLRLGEITNEAAFEQADDIAKSLIGKKVKSNENGVSIEKQNPLEFAGDFADAGVTMSSIVPAAGGVSSGVSKLAGSLGKKETAKKLYSLADLLNPAQAKNTSLAQALKNSKMNNKTAELIGDSITYNAKQANVYGTTQTVSDILSGRGVSPESLLVNYGAEFAMGAAPDIALGKIGQTLTKTKKAVDSELNMSLPEKTDITPKNKSEISVAIKNGIVTPVTKKLNLEQRLETARNSRIGKKVRYRTENQDSPDIDAEKINNDSMLDYTDFKDTETGEVIFDSNQVKEIMNLADTFDFEEMYQKGFSDSVPHEIFQIKKKSGLSWRGFRNGAREVLLQRHPRYQELGEIHRINREKIALEKAEQEALKKAEEEQLKEAEELRRWSEAESRVQKILSESKNESEFTRKADEIVYAITEDIIDDLNEDYSLDYILKSGELRDYAIKNISDRIKLNNEELLETLYDNGYDNFYEIVTDYIDNYAKKNLNLKIGSSNHVDPEQWTYVDADAVSVNELDDMIGDVLHELSLDYEVSRSTNPGSMRSRYISLGGDTQLRIANHDNGNYNEYEILYRDDYNLSNKESIKLDILIGLRNLIDTEQDAVFFDAYYKVPREEYLNELASSMGGYYFSKKNVIKFMNENIDLSKYKEVAVNSYNFKDIMIDEIYKIIDKHEKKTLELMDKNGIERYRYGTLEDSNGNMSNEQKKLIEKYHKHYFGKHQKGTLEFEDKILSANDNPALGVTVEYPNKPSKISIRKSQRKPEETYHHEAVHKALNDFTTEEEREALLHSYQNDMRLKSSNLNDIEELMAEDFINYVASRNPNNSRELTLINRVMQIPEQIKRIFERIIDSLRKLTGVDNTPEYQKFYRDLYEGKFANFKYKELSKAITEKTPRYRILDTSYGRIVEIDDDIIKNVPHNDKIKTIRKYIQKNLYGTYPLNGGIDGEARIGGVSAKKMSQPNIEIDKRGQITGNLPEILEVSKKIGFALDSKNHKFAKDGFEYRTAKVKVGDKIYDVRINVGISDNKKVFYTINGIKETPVHRIEDGFIPEYSKNIISNEDKNVNTKKYRKVKNQNELLKNKEQVYKLAAPLLGSENAKKLSKKADEYLEVEKIRKDFEEQVGDTKSTYLRLDRSGSKKPVEYIMIEKVGDNDLLTTEFTPLNNKIHEIKDGVVINKSTGLPVGSYLGINEDGSHTVIIEGSFVNMGDILGDLDTWGNSNKAFRDIDRLIELNAPDIKTARAVQKFTTHYKDQREALMKLDLYNRRLEFAKRSEVLLKNKPKKIKKKEFSRDLFRVMEKKVDYNYILDRYGKKYVDTYMKPQIRWMRKEYDNILDEVNSELVKNGYSAIPRRENYITHIIEEPNFFQKHGLGISELLPMGKGNMVSDSSANKVRGAIPDEIAGRTEATKARRKFNIFGLERKGNSNSQDFFKAYDSYLEPMLFNKYMTSPATRVRTIEKTIRAFEKTKEMRLEYIETQHGKRKMMEIKKKDEAKFKHKKYNNKNILGLQSASKMVIAWQEYGNILAGKTNSLDRKIIELGSSTDTAVKILQMAQTIVGRSTIVGSASATLAQTLSLPQIFASASTQNVFRGLLDYTASILPNSKMKKILSESSFMRARYIDASSRQKKALDKAIDISATPMNYVEESVANFAWMVSYNEARHKKGLNKRDAIIEADITTKKILGGRGIGDKPVIYNSKALGLFTQFGLEVNNMRLQFVGDFNTKQKIKFILAAYVMNLLYESLTGYTALPDYIKAVADTLDDVNNNNDDKKDTALNDITQATQRFLLETSKFIHGFSPVVSLLMRDNDKEAFFGKDSDVNRFGTSPVSKLFSPLSKLDDENGGKDLAKSIISSYVPTGNQIVKTYDGINSLGKNYIENKKGDIVNVYNNNNPANYLKGILFGKNAIGNNSEALGSGYSLNASERRVYGELNRNNPDKSKSFFDNKMIEKTLASNRYGGLDDTGGYTKKSLLDFLSDDNGINNKPQNIPSELNLEPVKNNSGEIDRRYYRTLISEQADGNSDYLSYLYANELEAGTKYELADVPDESTGNELLDKLKNAESKTSNNDVIKSAVKMVYGEVDVPDWVKDRFINEAGLNVKDVEYAAFASQSVTTKLDGYYRDLAKNSSKEELLDELTLGRKKSILNAGRYYYVAASDSVISSLQKEGYLTKNEARRLRRVEINSDGNIVSSSSSRSSRSGKKIKNSFTNADIKLYLKNMDNNINDSLSLIKKYSEDINPRSLKNRRPRMRSLDIKKTKTRVKKSKTTLG